MAARLREIVGKLGEYFGVEGRPTGIDFTANLLGCTGTIKAFLDFRVKQLGRVLVSFATEILSLIGPTRAAYSKC